MPGGAAKIWKHRNRVSTLRLARESNVFLRFYSVIHGNDSPWKSNAFVENWLRLGACKSNDFFQIGDFIGGVNPMYFSKLGYFIAAYNPMYFFRSG